MRSNVLTWIFVTVVAAGASVILGASGHAADGEILRYSSGASAGDQSSGRGRYAGYSGRPFAYQLPASSPVATAGYWYYDPLPTYQPPASNPVAIAGFRYYYQVRR